MIKDPDTGCRWGRGPIEVRYDWAWDRVGVWDF